MPKNIVILLDGTSNEIKKNRSNILRLYGTLKKDETQIVYYDPGVGTIGADGAWSKRWQKVVEVWGMATGWGLDANVKEAYRFLVENYDDGKRPGAKKDVGRDRIYIFGFSRGAYSARVLAGLIHALGLIDKRNINLLDYAYRAYKRIGEAEETFAEIQLYERILRPDRIPIRCLGLFDTVSSVIESGRYIPRLRKHAFTDANRSVETVRHAVAIDELRTMFRPQLWPKGAEYWAKPFDKTSAVTQDVREIWFSGVHGDTGGGYPEDEAGLAKIPLHWMIEETATEGLMFKTRTINEIVLGTKKGGKYVAPDPTADAHDSMTWGWKILEYLPRRKPKNSKRGDIRGWIIPQSEPRNIPDDAVLHKSVMERAVPPENLPTNYTEDG